MQEKIALLRYELEHPASISPDEMLQAVQAPYHTFACALDRLAQRDPELAAEIVSGRLR